MHKVAAFSRGNTLALWKTSLSHLALTLFLFFPTWAAMGSAPSQAHSFLPISSPSLGMLCAASQLWPGEDHPQEMPGWGWTQAEISSSALAPRAPLLPPVRGNSWGCPSSHGVEQACTAPRVGSMGVEITQQPQSYLKRRFLVFCFLFPTPWPPNISFSFPTFNVSVARVHLTMCTCGQRTQF